MKTSTVVAIGAGAGIVLALGLWLKKKVADAGGLVGAASGATRAAIGAAGDAASGVVLGIGDVIGLPRTQQDACDQAIASGRLWDASFVCPAGTLLGAVTGSYVPQNVGGYRMEGRNYPSPSVSESDTIDQSLVGYTPFNVGA
jgi:hypothetical protein